MCSKCPQPVSDFISAAALEAAKIELLRSTEKEKFESVTKDAFALLSEGSGCKDEFLTKPDFLFGVLSGICLSRSVMICEHPFLFKRAKNMWKVLTVIAGACASRSFYSSTAPVTKAAKKKKK